MSEVGDKGGDGQKDALEVGVVVGGETRGRVAAVFEEVLEGIEAERRLEVVEDAGKGVRQVDAGVVGENVASEVAAVLEKDGSVGSGLDEGCVEGLSAWGCVAMLEPQNIPVGAVTDRVLILDFGDEDTDLSARFREGLSLARRRFAEEGGRILGASSSSTEVAPDDLEIRAGKIVSVETDQKPWRPPADELVEGNGGAVLVSAVPGARPVVPGSFFQPRAARPGTSGMLSDEDLVRARARAHGDPEADSLGRRMGMASAAGLPNSFDVKGVAEVAEGLSNFLDGEGVAVTDREGSFGPGLSAAESEELARFFDGKGGVATEMDLSGRPRFTKAELAQLARAGLRGGEGLHGEALYRSIHLNLQVAGLVSAKVTGTGVSDAEEGDSREVEEAGVDSAGDGEGLFWRTSVEEALGEMAAETEAEYQVLEESGVPIIRASFDFEEPDPASREARVVKEVGRRPLEASLKSSVTLLARIKSPEGLSAWAGKEVAFQRDPTFLALKAVLNKVLPLRKMSVFEWLTSLRSKQRVVSFMAQARNKGAQWPIRISSVFSEDLALFAGSLSGLRRDGETTLTELSESDNFSISRLAPFLSMDVFEGDDLQPVQGYYAKLQRVRGFFAKESAGQRFVDRCAVGFSNAEYEQKLREGSSRLQTDEPLNAADFVFLNSVLGDIPSGFVEARERILARITARCEWLNLDKNDGARKRELRFIAEVTGRLGSGALSDFLSEIFARNVQDLCRGKDEMELIRLGRWIAGKQGLKKNPELFDVAIKTVATSRRTLKEAGSVRKGSGEYLD